ncbi:MAG: NAD-dependent epimerase/dehydratase family protein [Actinobacteria bacterium]|nr:NAD-dependent epimerase/dehydratase family protein [Actinomycetota bacterium]
MSTDTPTAPVLVTGATGFLGTDLARALLEQGRPVRILTRSTQPDLDPSLADAEIAVGDLMDPASLATALDGIEVAYHCAGVNAFCLPDPGEMYRVNVTGSANFMNAAADAGLRRVVYTSSAATIGEAAGTIGTESSPHRGSYLSHYERSKHLAEQRVMQVARARDLDVVHVNPASVQGPGRTKGTAKLLLAYLNGKLPVLVQTRLSVVDIADCTRGHLLAETRGEPGERYLLCGATMPIQEAIALLGELAGVSRAPRLIPGIAARALGAVAGAAGRARGRRSSFCPEMVRTLLHGHAYDGSRATRDLGLEYTPIRESIDRMVAWYRSEGLLSGGPAGVE